MISEEYIEIQYTSYCYSLVLSDLCIDRYCKEECCKHISENNAGQIYLPSLTKVMQLINIQQKKKLSLQ